MRSPWGSAGTISSTRRGTQPAAARGKSISREGSCCLCSEARKRTGTDIRLYKGNFTTTPTSEGGAKTKDTEGSCKPACATTPASEGGAKTRHAEARTSQLVQMRDRISRPPSRPGPAAQHGSGTVAPDRNAELSARGIHAASLRPRPRA